MESRRGIIIKINPRKRYGFIRDEQEEEEFYFHAVGVVSPDFKELREGLPVMFFAVDDNRGPLRRAIGITVE